jgi:hypothetical protein
MPGRSPNRCTKGPIPSTCPINRSNRSAQTGRKVSKSPNKSQDIGGKCSTGPMVGGGAGLGCSLRDRRDQRPVRPRAGRRPRRAGCSASAVRGAWPPQRADGLRSPRPALVANGGNEGGKPVGPRGLLRARSREPPRISLGKRGRSGAVREPPRVLAGNRTQSEVVRPRAPRVLRKTRALRQVARQRAQQASWLASLIAAVRDQSRGTESGARRRGRRAPRSDAHARHHLLTTRTSMAYE